MLRAPIARVLAGSLGTLIAGVLAAQAPTDPGADWPTYLGDNGRTHYSRLSQITRSNVGTLKTAWTYDTGDRGEFQANPLIVKGVLYICTATRKVPPIASTMPTGTCERMQAPASQQRC